MQAKNLSYKDIRQYIKQAVGSDTLKSICNFVNAQSPCLWGIDKPHGFVNESLCLVIYKDMTGDGYQKILRSISFLPNLSDKSFRENTWRLRVLLAKWGRNQITLGNKDDWEADKNLMENNPNLKSINLWIDSSNFPKIKYTGMSRKANDWSFKCNSPGLHFMMLESAS